MSLDNVVNTIYQSFQEHAASARVILLHFAGAIARPLSVGCWLTRKCCLLLRDGADDMDIPAFLSGFTHDLAEQVPTFGASVNLVGWTISPTRAAAESVCPGSRSVKR